MKFLKRKERIVLFKTLYLFIRTVELVGKILYKTNLSPKLY